jgi:hypothetical protein
MINKRIKILVATLSLATIWTGCKKDEDLVSVPQPVVNEAEIITTMKLKFVDSSDPLNIRYATFRDPDGDGGAAYDVFDTIRLQPNKTWITTIVLLNEITSPADTISNEVLEEGADHMFCFSPTGISATVTKTDLDANNLPIGLQSNWVTTTSGLGSMQITLKHQPGTKDGTCSPGSSDINVNFITKIQ